MTDYERYLERELEGARQDRAKAEDRFAFASDELAQAKRANNALHERIFDLQTRLTEMESRGFPPPPNYAEIERLKKELNAAREHNGRLARKKDDLLMERVQLEARLREANSRANIPAHHDLIAQVERLKVELALEKCKVIERQRKLNEIASMFGEVK